MKKYAFIAVATLLGSAAFAQTQSNYCVLDVFRPGFNKFVAVADFGNGRKPNIKQAALKDASGKVMKFASQAEALNYMTKQGWELVNVNHSKSDEIYFYLRKAG